VSLDPALALVGSAVEVALPEDGGNEALTVPRDALVQRQDQTYVMRVSAQNTAETDSGGGLEKRPATRSRCAGALAAGDRLVVRGGRAF